MTEPDSKTGKEKKKTKKKKDRQDCTRTAVAETGFWILHFLAGGGQKKLWVAETLRNYGPRSRHAGHYAHPSIVTTYWYGCHHARHSDMVAIMPHKVEYSNVMFLW